MRIVGKRYYDLPGIIELMHRLWATSVVDGFEFQNLAEWDPAGPPRDEAEERLDGWKDSQRYTTDQIAGLLRSAAVPIPSVHANRDVGICLCSGDEQDLERGQTLIHESLSLAQQVGAGVCVFHLWDTWKEQFDPALLQQVLCEAAAHYPGVKAAVENVPTHLKGRTPFDLLRFFEWITLDLQWAALYDGLDRYESLKERIANVHLRGRLADGAWVLDGAPFEFYEALETIKSRWSYQGLLTLEPNRLPAGEWDSLLTAIASLR